MTNGFYKLEDILLYGQSLDLPGSIHLDLSNINSQSYPIQGWYYFETFEEAIIHFGLIQEETVTTQTISKEATTLADHLNILVEKEIKKSSENYIGITKY